MTAHLSSPGPAGSHPSVEELADLAEGLVEPAAAVEALHRHLDGCAECRETVDALAEVQMLLGAAEPEPMPADIAARLDAALTDAALADAALADAALADAALADAAPSERPRPDAPPPPVRAAAAPSAPPARPATATGPGRPRPRPRRRRAALLLGATTVLAALGLGGALLLHSSGGGSDASTVAAAPAHISTAPGTAYQDDRLAAQIQQLLARSGAEPGLLATGPAKSDAAGGAQPAEGARPELSAPSGAPSPAPAVTPGACTAPAPGTPLATDRGSYQGAPVEVLVFPSPGRPGSVDVYLRSPECGPVLLHRTVPGR